MNATEMCGNMEWQRCCEVPFELELMFDASSGSKAAVGVFRYNHTSASFSECQKTYISVIFANTLL